ncbi:hypothetical protein JL722_7861 [Aureococcus anophagefferens]|nr:hypothetical protein JL722_7861 [Aureococcus anophagefferens]
MAAHVDAGGCKPLCVLNLGLACDFGAAAATAPRAGDGAALDAAATLHSVAVPADAGAGARVSLMFYAAPAPRARDDDFGDVPDGAAALFGGDGDGDGGDDGDAPTATAARRLLPRAAARGRGAERAVVLFDARNVYERRVGLFRAPGVADASLPLRQFGDLPRALREDRKALPTGATVLMYCTGGVRCEQASRALADGRDDLDVVQLAGGIHRYHERFGATGFFAGKNFVFDGRMAVAPGEPEVVGACATWRAAHYYTRHSAAAPAACACSSAPRARAPPWPAPCAA